MEKVLSKELIEKSAELIEKSDGYLITLYDEFMDFPIFEDKYNILYIYVEKYTDARLCQELFNSDPDTSKTYSAKFPEHKDFSNLTGFFIHLCPKFRNTNN